MSKKFTAAQLAALSHPFDGEAAPAEACKSRSLNWGANGILTCDVDDQTVENFGGPVWHASVCPPVRAYGESLLAGVGEGVLFDEPGVRPDMVHFRRRMTAEEIKRLGGAVRRTSGDGSS